MSRKNSLENKAIRRAEREAKAEGAADRQEKARRSVEIPAQTETDEDGTERVVRKASLFQIPGRRDRRRK